jgi:putative FmdB family regulatory protein
MPAYEYACRTCDREFVIYMTIKEKDHDTRPVQCPHCQGTNVERLFSPFVAVTAKKS